MHQGRSAPSKFGKIFDDIFGLPASENGVLGFLDRLSDVYLCTRVMRSPLSCLGGRPFGGAGTSGVGGGFPGDIWEPCGEYCLSLADAVMDVPFVVYDLGQVIGAITAYAVGAATRNDALTTAAAEGLVEARGNLIGSTTALAVPFLPAWTTRTANASATVFKTGHYASRLEAAGVNVARAESVVAKEVAAMRANMAIGADVAGRLRIDNVLVEYHARLLPGGSVNVGTIFPVK